MRANYTSLTIIVSTWQSTPIRLQRRMEKSYDARKLGFRNITNLLVKIIGTSGADATTGNFAKSRQTHNDETRGLAGCRRRLRCRLLRLCVVKDSDGSISTTGMVSSFIRRLQ